MKFTVYLWPCYSLAAGHLMSLKQRCYRARNYRFIFVTLNNSDWEIKKKKFQNAISISVFIDAKYQKQTPSQKLEEKRVPENQYIKDSEYFLVSSTYLVFFRLEGSLNG